MTCKVPPEGWFCTRDEGHAGPCAAWPQISESAAPRGDDFFRMYKETGLPWFKALAISELPDVNECLLAFYDNGDENSAVCLIQAILDSQKPCQCGDRPLTGCPEPWEPGCDLGANEKFVKVVHFGRPDLPKGKFMWRVSHYERFSRSGGKVQHYRWWWQAKLAYLRGICREPFDYWQMYRTWVLPPEFPKNAD